MASLYSGTLEAGVTTLILEKKERRGVEITVKGGGPVSIHCGDDASLLTRENGNDIFPHQNFCINNSVDASTAIYAVAETPATWSAREFLAWKQ
jgi:hypothetical protein